MKKGAFNFLLFVLIVVCLAGNVKSLTCTDNERIVRISSPTNAHGSLWNKADYLFDICSPNNETVNHAKNPFLWLNANTNAHASIFQDSIYNIPVYFGGELNCSIRFKCDSEETGIVFLSGETDAHLIFSNSCCVGNGDVDNSGVVLASDALLVWKYVNGTINLTMEKRARGDVDGDCILTYNDSQNILQLSTGRSRDFLGLPPATNSIYFYPIKVCCKKTVSSPITPSVGSLYWSDMNKNLITTSEIADSVQIFIENAGNLGDHITILIKENDTGEGGLFGIGEDADNIETLDVVVNSEGDAVAVWAITQEAYNNADSESLNENGKVEFYFEALGNYSSNIDVYNLGGLNSPLDIKLIYPNCGDYFFIGEEDIIVGAIVNDTDDFASGNIDFGDGIVESIKNGLNSYNHTYSSSNSFQIKLNVSSTRGDSKTTYANIIVINKSKDDTYFAACIGSPLNLVYINETNVHFNANRTRVIKYTSGTLSEMPLKDIIFNWTFKGGTNCVFLGNTFNCTDANGVKSTNMDATGRWGYNLHYQYPSVGLNWAKLEVSI